MKLIYQRKQIEGVWITKWDKPFEGTHRSLFWPNMDFICNRGQTLWPRGVAIPLGTNWTCKLQDPGVLCWSRMWSSQMRWPTLTVKGSQRELSMQRGQVSVIQSSVIQSVCWTDSLTLIPTHCSHTRVYPALIPLRQNPVIGLGSKIPFCYTI